MRQKRVRFTEPLPDPDHEDGWAYLGILLIVAYLAGVITPAFFR